MLTSLFSKHEDVIAVKQSSAAFLKDLLLNVIKILTQAGCTIISLISDNHRMNRSAYTLLSSDGNSKNVSSYINNPFRTEDNFFLLFDTVHLFKSIRNNWLNQKNMEQSFTFSHIEHFSQILSANLTDLKKLYLSEGTKIVKLAPALLNKVLYPSNLERQNVLLAVKLFDEKT